MTDTALLASRRTTTNIELVPAPSTASSMSWFWIVVLVLVIVVIALVVWSWSSRNYRNAKDDVNAAAITVTSLETNFSAFQTSFAALSAAITDMESVSGVSGSTYYTALTSAEAASAAYLPTLSGDIVSVRRRVHAAQSALGLL